MGEMYLNVRPRNTELNVIAEEGQTEMIDSSRREHISTEDAQIESEP